MTLGLSPHVNMVTKYVGGDNPIIITQRRERTTGHILGHFQVKNVYFGISSKYHCISLPPMTLQIR